MLSIASIKALAQQHGLDLSVHWPAATTRADVAPQPSRLTVFFTKDAPEAWDALMSQRTEVEVSVYGTRQVTGSGATDGLLKPVYAALLDEVNARRNAVGLQPVFR